MKRTRRQGNNYGFKVIGYANDDEIVVDVEDRFNTRIAVSLGEGMGWVPRNTLAETGIYGLTVADIVALGFTTDEYKAMLRYTEATGPRAFIGSEYELTALMSGKVPSLIEELQIAYEAADPGDVPKTDPKFPTLGTDDRRRGNDWEKQVHAVGWIDENGQRVQRVADRFQARHAFIGAAGQHMIAEPLGVSGVNGLSLVDMVALGFSKAEFLTLHAYQNETFECVQSEEELDELVRNPPSSIRSFV